jgi:hypothetical protein
MTIGEFLQRCHALSSVYQWLVALTSRSTLVADLVSESSTRRLVLEAFDTLFNKRDYAAAERYWSPHYIQHSNHIEPGRPSSP